MPRVVPAILVNSEAEFRKQVSQAAIFAPAIQIDALDGTMVPEKSFSDPQAIAAMKLSMPFEVHIMSDRPAEEAKKWVRAGASAIIVHAEAKDDIMTALESARHAGRVAGVAIDPATDLAIAKKLAPFVDHFQVMGVLPGAQGRPFDPETVDRVRSLKAAFPNITVGIDGGVNATGHIARLLARAGADELVVGSAIWRAPDPVKAYRDIVADAAS